MEVLRVKEVRFRIRLPTGFKYNDSNYNEIDYEISRQKNLNATSKSIEVLEINDLGDSDDDDVSSNPKNNSVQSIPNTFTTKAKPPFKKSQSVQQFASKSLKRTNTDASIEVPNLEDSEDDDDDDDDDINGDSEDSGDIVVSYYCIIYCLLTYLIDVS